MACYKVVRGRVVCNIPTCINSDGYMRVIDGRLVQIKTGCFTSFFIEKYLNNSNKQYRAMNGR